MPVTEGQFPVLEYEYDCLLGSPVSSIIGKKICSSVYVESWPHAEQELIIEYMPMNRDGRESFKTMVIGHPYPGMLIPFVEPMDCVFRTRYAMPLLVGWRIRLLLLSDESMPYPVRQDPAETQWTPMCRGQSIPNGALPILIGVYWPTRSGILRYRIFWTPAPTTPRLTVNSYCRANGQEYLLAAAPLAMPTSNHEGFPLRTSYSGVVFLPYLSKDISYIVYADHNTAAGSRSLSLDLSTVHGGAGVF